MSIASTMRSIASSTGTPLSCVPSRNRNETLPDSWSFAPAMSWKGTFMSVWLRIFFCMRSSERSTSTRTPFARSFAAMPSR